MWPVMMRWAEISFLEIPPIFRFRSVVCIADSIVSVRVGMLLCCAGAP